MTVNNHSINNIEKLLKPIFQNKTEVLFAYFFGSCAIKKSTTLSDIDIAIYVKNSVLFTFNDKLAIYADCCRALKTNMFLYSSENTNLNHA